MRVIALTRRGTDRTENQDRVVIDGAVLASGHSEPVVQEIGPHVLLAVVDGMGGHSAGGVAAAIVADVIASGHQRTTTTADIEALVTAANDKLYAMMARVPSLSGMGATIAGLAATQEGLIIFNVGDARVYLADGGYLMLASVDDRRPGAARGAVTQSLGGLHSPTAVDVHITCEPAGTGRVLVASDGLTARTPHEALASVVSSPLEEAADALLGAALAAGGTDDISFGLLALSGDPPEAPGAGSAATTPRPATGEPAGE